MPSLKEPTSNPTVTLHCLSWHCFTSNLLVCVGLDTCAKTQLTFKFFQPYLFSPGTGNARSKETPAPAPNVPSGQLG